MASKVIEDMNEDFLVCSICMGQFKTPKMLPCIHSFCEGCLEKFAAKQDDKNIPCPLCRKVCKLPETGVKGLQTNFHLINLAERVSILEKFTSTQQPLPSCEPCKSPEVVAYCTDCDFAMCSKCQVHHNHFPLLRDHDVVPLSKLRDPKFQKEWKTSKPPNCDVHTSEKLQFFCKTCSKLICNHCAIVVHSKHECTEAMDQFQSTREALHKQVEGSDALLESGVEIADRGESALKAMEVTNNEVELEIERHCNDMMKKMEKAVHDQKELLISEIDVKPKNVQTQIKRAKEWIERMKITQDLSRKLLEENNPWETIAMSNDLIKSFKELKDGSSSLDWLEWDLEHEVKFTPYPNIPTIELGSCDIGPKFSPDVVVTDNQGNFLLCQFLTKNGTFVIHKKPYTGNDAQEYAPIKCSTKLDEPNDLFACCDNNNSLYFAFCTTVVVIPNTIDQVRTCTVQMQGYGAKVQCLGYNPHQNLLCIANDSVGEQNMMQGIITNDSDQANNFERDTTYSLPASSPITYILPANLDVLYYTASDGLKTYDWVNNCYHKTYAIDPPTNVMTIARTEIFRAFRNEETPAKCFSNRGYRVNRRCNSFTVFILWGGAAKGTDENAEGGAWVIKEYNTGTEKVVGVLECLGGEHMAPMAMYNHSDNNTGGMGIYLCDETGTITRYKRGRYNNAPVQYNKG